MTNKTPLILIVDDDVFLQQATARVLVQTGYRICQASDGRSGLQMARDQKPDLMLLDVNLPDLSGFEVCGLIKTDPELMNCFVVLFSGSRTDFQSQVDGLEGGADGYIARPVTNAELLARVRGMLRIQQTEYALQQAHNELEQRVAERTEQLRLANDHLRAEIIERKHATEKLQKSEASLRAVFENSLQSFLFVDIDRKVLSFNRIANERSMLVFGKGLHPGDSIYEVVLPQDRQSFDQDFQHAQDGESVRAERKYKVGLLEYCYEFYYTPVYADDESVNGVFISIQDITERKRSEDALRESQELFAQFMLHTPVYTYFQVVTPTESRVLQASDNYKEMIGIPGRDLVGKTLAEVFPPELAAKINADNWRCVSTGEVLRLDEDFNGRHYTSIKFPIHQSGKTLLAGYTIDITERKEAEEERRLLNIELERLALTDYLTSLYNRRYFMQRSVEEFKRARRNNQPLALLMLDLDEFKKVNDAYGHEAGDFALQQVAVAMKSCLREVDILGRLGGEEFAVLLPDTSLEEAVLLAERVRLSIANLSFTAAGAALMITISIGVVAYTVEMSGIDDLLRNADAAMYRAKQSGRNCVIVSTNLSCSSSHYE